MRYPRIKSRPICNLLMAAFLIAGQWSTLVHAFEHEAGTPQSQVCATCVAASQLGCACIDTAGDMPPAPSYAIMIAATEKEFKSVHTLVARQRGPPTPL